MYGRNIKPAECKYERGYEVLGQQRREGPRSWEAKEGRFRFRESKGRRAQGPGGAWEGGLKGSLILWMEVSSHLFLSSNAMLN